MKQVILFTFLLALLSSCGGKSKSSSVIEAEKAIPLRYAENLSLSATEDYTIARLRNPWDTTRILHTYVLVDKKVPACRLAGRDTCPHAIEQGRCLLIRTLRIAQPDWCFEKYWRSLRFEVYQTARSAGWLPHRKHRRCREWNEPGYRKDNRPASRCHYALPF